MDYPIFSSADSGSELILQFNPPIRLNEKKKYTMSLINSTLFFTFANLFNTTSEAGTKNNVLNFTQNAVQYTITFEQGLYDIISLNETLSRELTNLGLNASLISITGNQATQKSVIQLNSATCSINFSTSSIRNILGFNAVTIGPGVSGTFYTSNNRANFNSLSEVLVHCSACTGFYNNRGIISSVDDVLASIVIDSAVGSQIVFSPNLAIRVPINESTITRLTFRITDQENRPLINEEKITFTCVIEEWKG